MSGLRARVRRVMTNWARDFVAPIIEDSVVKVYRALDSERDRTNRRIAGLVDQTEVLSARVAELGDALRITDRERFNSAPIAAVVHEVSPASFDTTAMMTAFDACLKRLETVEKSYEDRFSAIESTLERAPQRSESATPAAAVEPEHDWAAELKSSVALQFSTLQSETKRSLEAMQMQQQNFVGRLENMDGVCRLAERQVTLLQQKLDSFSHDWQGLQRNEQRLWNDKFASTKDAILRVELRVDTLESSLRVASTMGVDAEGGRTLSERESGGVTGPSSDGKAVVQKVPAFAPLLQNFMAAAKR